MKNRFRAEVRIITGATKCKSEDNYLDEPLGEVVGL